MNPLVLVLHLHSPSTLPSWGTAVHKYEKKKCQGKLFISLRVITSSDILVWDHGSSVF